MLKSQKKSESTSFDILIVSKTNYDISKYDFSFKDITIYDIESEGIVNYITNLNPEISKENLHLINQLRSEIKQPYEKKYAIVKNNPLKDYNQNDLHVVFVLLLIIFPSDFQIENILHFWNEDGFIQRTGMTVNPKRYTGNYPGKLIHSRDKYVEEINTFSRLVFDRINSKNYIGLAIENYVISFNASHIHFQYITLCTALECVISGSQELSYRLRRTIAVLCAEEKGEGVFIFKNLTKLYELRSKIVHGEKYDVGKVEEYLLHLQSVVSRTIIELLIHDVQTNVILNEIATSLGYGDREKISANWNHFELNPTTVIETNWGDIK